jgi:3-hydroxyacyl-CoA dehydrogenase
MASPISIEFVSNGTDGEIAVITSNNPPVNALSHAVRSGLKTQMQAALANDRVQAIVIACEGRSFFAGADIKEFGKPMQEPFLPDVINQIEAAPVPVVAAMHGTALGGGLEVALGAHYRVAADTAKMGLPEVTLGLLPGAGGTQRLPRVIAMQDAAVMITGGRPVKAAQALEMGLVDQVVPLEGLRDAAIAYALDLVATGQGARPTRERACNQMDAAAFDALSAKVAKAARGAIGEMSGRAVGCDAPAD